MSGARAPSTTADTPALVATWPRRSSEATTTRPITTCDTGSTVSGWPALGRWHRLVLRVPVPIELVPVFRVLPDPRAELVGKLLRGALNRGIPWQIGRHDNRLAGFDPKQASLGALDETGHQRRASKTRH